MYHKVCIYKRLQNTFEHGGSKDAFLFFYASFNEITSLRNSANISKLRQQKVNNVQNIIFWLVVSAAGEDAVWDNENDENFKSF